MRKFKDPEGNCACVLSDSGVSDSGFGTGDVAILRCREHVRGGLTNESLSSHVFSDLYGPVLGRSALVALDGAEHRRLRDLLMPMLSARNISSRYPNLVRETVDEVFSSALAAHRAIDLHRDIGRVIPTRIIARLLGVSERHEIDLASWSDAIIGYYEAPEAGVRASAQLRRLLRGIIASAITNPGDDLVSRLLSGSDENSGLSPEHVLSLMRLVVPASITTTSIAMTGLLAKFVVGSMGGNPVGHASAEALVHMALAEAPPISVVVRRTTTAAVIDGLMIPSDTTVLLSMADAIKCPKIKEGETTSSGPNRRESLLVFGLGAHRCIGMSVALIELTEAAEWLQREGLQFRLLDRGSQDEAEYRPVRCPDALTVTRAL